MLNTIDVDLVIDIARKAGNETMTIYTQDFDIETKDDSSPLTEADKMSNKVIVERLNENFPDVPLISEENQLTPYDERKAWTYFWMIDPLDGTKEFIKKNGEFTVNIALINRNEPVLGVVYLPAKKEVYYAVKGKGAFKIDKEGKKVKMENSTSYLDKQKIVVIASRSHLSGEVVEFVDKLKARGKEVDFLSAGSSLKLCLVAEGKADVYPRFGPTMEWDTAAAHCVAVGAGKKVLNAGTKEPLQYNKQSLLNPYFIVE